MQMASSPSRTAASGSAQHRDSAAPKTAKPRLGSGSHPIHPPRRSTVEGLFASAHQPDGTARQATPPRAQFQNGAAFVDVGGPVPSRRQTTRQPSDAATPKRVQVLRPAGMHAARRHRHRPPIRRHGCPVRDAGTHDESQQPFARSPVVRLPPPVALGVGQVRLPAPQTAVGPPQGRAVDRPAHQTRWGNDEAEASPTANWHR